MHYVIGLITALAGLLFALNRLQRAGLDLDALNPFLWYRRLKWQKKLTRKPIHTLDRPMEVAALLILGTAKCEGEISAEQKRFLHDVFTAEFHLSEKDATALTVSSAYLLRDEETLCGQLDQVIEPCKERFSPDQATSTIELMDRMSQLDGPPTEEQATLLAEAEMVFSSLGAQRPNWS